MGRGDRRETYVSWTRRFFFSNQRRRTMSSTVSLGRKCVIGTNTGISFRMKKIGIIDSGIGGLSILSHLLNTVL